MSPDAQASFEQAAPPDQLYQGLERYWRKRRGGGRRMSGGTTIELPRVGGPESGLGGNWRVIVLNDDHNTFEGVAQALARVLPGVTYDGGHGDGEHHPQQRPRHRLDRAAGARRALLGAARADAGLTMAPLERG